MKSILNISEAASIAIHSLAIIAGAKDRINVNQLAEMTGFSKNHIAKILQQLAKKGYVDADRGPHGGYVIKKDSSQVSLFEIYELIDGALPESHCGIHDGKCPFKECVYGDLHKNAEREFRSYLQNKFIHDVI